MKKKIPNIISSSRILFAIAMFFFTSISNLFLTLYILCGISDFADGKLARHFDASSLLGAKLDTAGDVLYYLALSKILIFQKMLPLWVVIWLCINVVGLTASAIIAKIKFGKFYYIHSLFGKIMGLSIFVLPFFLRLISNSTGFIIVCVASSIAAIEAIYLQLKNKTLKLEALPTRNK